MLNSSSTATEVVRVVLNSSSSTVAAPVLGGPEVVRARARCVEQQLQHRMVTVIPVLGGPECERAL